MLILFIAKHPQCWSRGCPDEGRHDETVDIEGGKVVKLEGGDTLRQSMVSQYKIIRT